MMSLFCGRVLRSRHFRFARLSLALVVAGVVSNLPPIARAQTFRGAIEGTVTDQTQAPIAGAKVTVKNQDTGVERLTQTNEVGQYNVPELQIGTYTVTVENPGFTIWTASGVTVDVASAKRIDAVLKPGAVTQEVVVSAQDLPQVETTNNTLGSTLTANTLKELPVNGRDYTKLIYLSPGVAGSPDQISDSPGSYGTFSMNGARGRSNNFLLDGTDMNDGYRNDPAINEAGVFGTPATILPVDAVSELRVLSNYEPEYGRNAGAVINIVTKSGTNNFHGSALEYFRNDALDARNFFNSTGTKAPFHNNQFGGSLGGPIVKDKTFFFVDYEGQRETVGVVSLATVPDPSQLVATNPVIQSLLNHYPNHDPWPAPNLGGNTASVVAPSFNSVDSLIAKADHNFNASNLLSGRYYLGDSGQAFPLALAGGGILPGFNTQTPTRVQLVSISWASVRSSTKVNELRFGWNRFAEGFYPQDKTFEPSSIGLCAATTTEACTGAVPSNQGLPVIDVADYAQLGASKSTPRNRVDTNWQAFDNFSWEINKHSVKFGYEFRRTTISQFLGTNFRGILQFSSLADFLSGTVDGGSQSLGDPNRNTYENNHGLYVQDSFHTSRRLTLNYGLRWDYFGLVTEKHNLFSNITSFDPAAGTFRLTQVGSSGLSSLYRPDYTNFAPRVSLAWDPLGKSKTVIRAGFGLFYDAFSQDLFLAHLPYNCVFCPGPAYNPFGPEPIFSVSPTGTLATGVPAFSAPGATPAGDVFVADRNIRTPYMENYNLNLQQLITHNVTLQIGYVGSQGHKLFRFRDLDQPTQAVITATDLAFAQATPGCVSGAVAVGGPGCIPAYNSASRVYPNNPYGAYYVNYEESSANSNYNSLQASLRMSNWHGVTSMVNYVWSHSLDAASDGEDFIPNAAQPTDSTNPRLDYGNSNFDIRNRFTWVLGYQLPNRGGSYQRLKNGWGFNSTVSLQDGQPFQLNYNFEGDFSGSGEGFDRPDVVGPIHYTTDPANFISLGSFGIPCTPTATALSGNISGTEQDCLPGTRHFGNLGRGALRGPSFKQWDFSFHKDTPLSERVTMQLRAEFFNILNHPNFANPMLPLFIADAGQQGFTMANGREVGAGAYAIGATGDVGIGNPFLGGGGPRGIQLAAKFSF